MSAGKENAQRLVSKLVEGRFSRDNFVRKTDEMSRAVEQSVAFLMIELRCQ
jgi:hypothetical protein